MNIIASIVIYKHTYNDIKETLKSLISTSSIEKVILVDNDSSEWASAYKHPKIIYEKSEGNFGFGYAHNIAINKYAKESNFFLICNPDIYFEFSEFDNFFNFVKTRNEGLFLPKIVYANGQEQYGARLLPSPLHLFVRRFSPSYAFKLDKDYLLKNYLIEKPIFAPYLSGCFMLFNSSKLIALEGFDERFFMYMEDVDLSRRCAEHFGTVYYPLAQVVHIHEKASYKSKKLLKAHLKSAIQYFNKWGWFYDVGRKKLNIKCLNQFSMKSDKFNLNM